MEMEGQNDPEDRAGAPDEGGFPEAERELWLRGVPGQVRVPKGVVAAQTLETFLFLHVG